MSFSDDDLGGCATVIGAIIVIAVVVYLLYYLLQLIYIFFRYLGSYIIGTIIFVIVNFFVFLINLIKSIYYQFMLISTNLDRILFALPIDPILAWALFGFILTAPFAFIIATKKLKRPFAKHKIASILASFSFIAVLSTLSLNKISPDKIEKFLLDNAERFKKEDNVNSTLKCYTNLIKINPSKPEYYIKTAEAFSYYGYIKEAISYIDSAIKLNPSPEVYMLKAKYYEKSSDWSNALDNYKKAKQLLSNDFWLENKINDKIKEMELNIKISKQTPPVTPKTQGTKSTSTEPSPPASTTPSLGIITGAGVLMRSENSFSGSVLKTLSRGEEVYILGKTISTNENEAVTRRDLTVNTSIGTVKLNRGKLVYIIGETPNEFLVSFRYQNLELTASIPKNELKKISGQYWYKIKTKSGQVGWVFGDYIKEK